VSATAEGVSRRFVNYFKGLRVNLFLTPFDTLWGECVFERNRKGRERLPSSCPPNDFLLVVIGRVFVVDLFFMQASSAILSANILRQRLAHLCDHLPIQQSIERVCIIGGVLIRVIH
jgi:hypothetical protein